MALDWGMAAVIVAILTFLWTSSPHFKQTVLPWLRGVLWPETTHCDSLLWSDFPSDDQGVHDCGVTPASCLHRNSRRPHTSAPNCWQSTISIVFNRAWNSPGRRSRMTCKKPLQLNPNKTYLKTDAQTVLAFFAYATSKFKNPPSGSQRLSKFGNSTSTRGLKFEDAKLVLEEAPDLKGGKAVLVAHLEGSLIESEAPIRLTKKELQRMTRGFPTFYRETLQVRPSGRRVPYPIHDLEDASVRGAWIIAVGMNQSTTMAMPLYFDPTLSGSYDEVNPLDGLGRQNNPLTRVLQTLKLIKRAFSSASANDKTKIQAVIDSITEMHKTQSESSECDFSLDTESIDLGSNNITDLRNAVQITISDQQCEFVLGLFRKSVTERSTLSIADKAQLDPILFEVLHMALCGTIRVIGFYKHNKNRVKIPDLLREHEVVYLTGCNGE